MGYGPRTGSYGPRTASYGDRPSSGGITIVQSKAGTTANGSLGLTVTFDSALKAGNSVIAFISAPGQWAVDVGFDTPPRLVGGGAANLTVVASSTPATVSALLCGPDAWVTSGGETGITFSLDSAVRANLQVIEVSGLADAAAEDTVGGSGGNGNAIVTDTIVPISASNLVVVMYASVNNAYASGPEDFTRIGTGTGGGAVFQEAGYLIQELASPQVGTWSTPSNGGYADCGAAFGGS